MRKRTLASMLCLVTLAFVLCLGSARADVLYLPPIGAWTQVTVNVGSTPVVEYGGTGLGATLNNQALPWIYCLERTTSVNVPGTYNATIVTNDGSIHGSVLSTAGQIAWLLDNYLAVVPHSSSAQALQAAIWHVQDVNVTLSGNSEYTTMINALTAAGPSATGNIGNYAWISPAPGTNQGLITSVPDGGMTLMLLGGALVGLETLRRKLRV